MAPEGLLKVARQFIAGYRVVGSGPIGTVEIQIYVSCSLNRPDGTPGFFVIVPGAQAPSYSHKSLTGQRKNLQ